MALENILSQEIVQKLGWTLLHFVWQAAAVALLVAILLALLRKFTANLRYIVACAALGLTVLLPVATMQMVPISTPQPMVNIEPRPAPVIAQLQPINEETPLAKVVEYEEPPQPESVSPAPAATWKQRAAERLEPALPYIVSAWLLGVLGLSLWHLGGWAQLQRLRKKLVRQVDNSVHNKLRQLSERMQVKQAVQLLESALVQVPTVVGWLRPVILLPASALTGLTTEQLEALLAHELAHIRRYDYLVNMLQTVVETLGFYHPAVWWISHKIRVERENCCDDLAVSISGDRIRYARALTSMEEIRAGRSDLAVAASGGNLFGRIRRLVGKDSTEPSRTSWIPSVITILLIAIIAIPTTLALTGQKMTTPSSEFLLDKMLKHRSQVRNLQYVAENNIWRDPAAEQDRIEKQIKSMREKGIPERQLERFRQAITEAPESRYQILKCTVDDEEHVKIEQTGGNYDSSGKKVTRDDKHIWAWNGVSATNFSQRSALPASAIIKDTPQVAMKLGHPWRSFTGIFCGFLEETIAAGKPVSVENLKDGTYRVTFDYKASRYATVVDPSKGYTCSLQETYNEQGQLNSRTTATYEEVAEGIWFPISGQRQEYTPKGAVRYRSIAKSSQIRINDPSFNAGYFDVDMPEGTAVRDEVQGKQYVVGSKHVYDLDERQKSIAETEEIDPNSWQEKFYSIYSLEDGQVLKRIAPPFIPERRGYLKSIQPGRYSPNTPFNVVSQYFNWDGNLSIRGARVGSGIPRLKSTMESVIGLGNRQYDIPPEILSADMSGDWIVRKDTPQEELLRALEQILKDETSREIDFVKQNVETEVIIAKGKYNFQLLPNITDGQYVLISTNNTDTYTGGGGGSGTLGKFLRWVGNRVGMNIIDETEAEDIELSWRNHDSSELSRLNHDGEPYNQKLDLLLKNLTRQTGLTFSGETATVEKWFVSENGTIKAPQKTYAAAVPERAMLTMAIVPNIDGAAREPSLTKEEYQQYLNSLANSGPFAESVLGDRFRWFTVKGNIDRFKQLPLSIYKEQTYILLCMQARYVMVPRIEGRQVWGLVKVQPVEDRSAISIQFDEKGAELFYNLTKANIGNHLALSINGQVLSAPRIETSMKKFATITGDFNQEEMLYLIKDLQKAAPATTDAENETQQQLNEILKKFSDETSDDKSRNDSKSVRESVERYIAAALAGEDKKAAEYAYPDSAVAAQTKDMREALQGQNTRIVGICIGEWNSLAISSVIQADGMTGSLVFHLKKLILDQKVLWLIDDIDLEEIDSIGEQIHYFINNVPDAKTITISSDAYTDKQAEVPLKDDRSTEGRQEQEAETDNIPKDSLLAKTAVPSCADKSIVKIECLVGEAFSEPKMDRETIIAIENLLGGKIIIPDSPAAADLLRKAAAATAAVKDESAGDKRVTQEQFNGLVDLLLSRGFVKILLRPTLEVVHGQTAKIMTNENSIDVTPTVRENGSIILHANLDLTLKSEEPDANQPPSIRRWKMTTSVNINSGQSWVVEGMKAAEKSSGAREQKSELLVILTPSIIPPDEPKEPIETVNFQNVEAKTIIEKLAAWTGKTIIPPDELMKQKITIYSPEPMPRSEAAAMILNALCSKGYTAEQTEDTIYLKSLPEEQPGTGKTKIQIDARIMTVGDEFLKEIGFDANSVPDMNAWPEPKPSAVSRSVNLKIFNIALNDSNVDFLLKTARANKDTEMLTAPRVTTWDRDTAEVSIAKEYNYTSGYSEPNSPADKPVPKFDTATLGSFLKIKPQVMLDNKNIIIFIDCELKIRRLQSVEDRMYEGKYPYQIPRISAVRTKTQCLIPDGVTLLNYGHKITQQFESTSTVPILGGLPVASGLIRSSSKVADTRTLLVMVKPTIVSE